MCGGSSNGSISPRRAINLDDVREAPLSLMIPMWLLVLANLYFGVDTRLTVGVSKLAAQSLFGVTP
jgi:multicomponent Na+:H+ antiporter subunit D